MEDWKKDLDDLFRTTQEEAQKKKRGKEEDKSEAIKFYESIVIPAFTELKSELERHGRKVKIYKESGEYASISIIHEGNEEYNYALKVRNLRPIPETEFTDIRIGKRFKSEGSMRSGSQDYIITDISKDEIIRHFLCGYKDHVKYRTQK